MRISDWSSDVCSSDLSQQTTSAQDNFDLAGSIYNPAKINGRIGAVWSEGGFSASAFANYTGGVREDFWSAGVGERTASFTTVDATLSYRRSEEHTYELQSLMRISYDVFCLKKKKKKQIITP